MKKIIPLTLFISLALASCDTGGSTTPKDMTPPSVSLSGSQSGTAVSLTATATDASPITKVEFYRGTSTTPFYTDTAAPYNATYSVSSTDNGTVSFTAKAYDNAGNVGQGGTTVNVYVAPPATKTLYQGVWLWLTINAQGDVTRSGLAVYDEEGNLNYGKVAAGVYGEYAVPTDYNSTFTAQGFTILGPVTESGLLQARFLKGTTPDSTQMDILADDDDNIWGQLDNGSAFFFDDDAELRNDDGTSTVVSFGMGQISDQLPNGAIQTQALSNVLKTLNLKSVNTFRATGTAPRINAEAQTRAFLQQHMKTVTTR